ncbi:SDR family NAD(P)-dependent oxidoreductase [Candidatus Stoquefichus massiliensis]|uniref:SDR family NAD(P)-dependent oxidoreductase n=1 Tax=Candidatus Stoquefichus massiliensis TaxID=1470350 RepID=UPI0004815A40|nr:SDR family oxidoreductase [Candidatus Stoquefichus massiliensis]
MKMKDKVVIITGGGKGIGRGVAEAFAEEGANLVITGRHQEALNQAKAELEEEFHNQVLALQADGSIEEDVKKVIQKTVEKFGHIDVLINNAMASRSGMMLTEHKKEDFELAIQTGLYAVYFYMREAHPYLKESHGAVINFASGAGFSGRIGQSSYVAAKEGIRGLSRVAATEWGSDGINVNIICPLVETQQMLKWKEEHPDHYAKTIQGIPLGRFGDAKKDVGRTCVFLASEDASFMSGETVVLQGGSGLRP